MNFGQALEALKSHKQVSREGWNGKGMHLYLEDALSVEVKAGAFKGAVRKYEPCVVMFTAQGKHQPGWLASQADILATDWGIVGAEPTEADPPAGLPLSQEQAQNLLAYLRGEKSDPAVIADVQRALESFLGVQDALGRAPKGYEFLGDVKSRS